MKRILVCTLTLLFFSFSRADAEDFTGTKWITADDTLTAPNQWLCFRKQIDLKEKQAVAQLCIAVDSKYWLWINGKMVVFEGGLKRGPNPEDTYYDRVSVAPYLKRGKNTIAILVWYWGKDGFSHKSSGKPGLLAQLSFDHQQVLSDESWKATVHPAYGTSNPPYPNPRLSEPNIRFDARKDIAGWEQGNFNDVHWRFAKVAGIYPCGPWNRLVERPFPNWYDSGILPYTSVTHQRSGGKLVIKAQLPRNLSVTPYLKIKSAAGKLIDIRTDNYKGGSEYNVRAEYITKNGLQEFEAYNYVNGHQVIYTLPEGAAIISLGYRETRFNTACLGSFRCSDPFYNKLWTKAKNTMNLNMRDAIQDADRERSQWWGDAAIVEGEILYTCDSNGLKLIKKAIKNLVDWQKPNGVLYSPVPTGKYYKELPAQMLASVGRFGFWNYYRYTGDSAIIRYVYPMVKRYLALWSFDENGLLNHRAGDWDWYDWGNQIDTRVLENTWYYLALESAHNMALLLDFKKDALAYYEKMQKIRTAVNTFLWNGSNYRSPDYKGKTDDRANGLAMLAGFAGKAKQQSVLSFLNGYANAGPYMEKYILESLFQQGYARLGLERMKKRYREMVYHAYTTLWEDWRIGGAGGGSINHGWAGGPLTLLSQYVAGVQPLEAGWKTFIIKPQLGTLQWVKCVVPVSGNKVIKVVVHKASRQYTLDTENSLGCRYLVAVPKAMLRNRITINRKKYSPAALQQLHKQSVSYDHSDEDYLYLNTSLKKLKLMLD